MRATRTGDLLEARAPASSGGPVGRFGVAGAEDTRLLAGPARAEGPESHAAHLERLGELPLAERSPAELRDELAASGLTGRGGGQFPFSAKAELATRSPGERLVVVNASEGEPASRKDRTLLALRPHLVLDGALAAAHAIGARDLVVYLHRSRHRSTAALEAALRERPGLAARVRLVDAPERYVAGEASAVVSYLAGDGALPRRSRVPVAAAGVGGRPTLVSNAETYAHLALIARFGADWFRTAGTPGTPGSSLVTLAGTVAVPGIVAEVLDPVPLGAVLATVGGLDAAPRAVLLGGYEGTWVDGEVAWRAPLERQALGAAGASLGCGLVAVLGAGCGLATTARLLDWLAGESAGQCGSCLYGLPDLADRFGRLASGGATRRDERHVRQLVASIAGRGACGHPSGVARLVESALDTFAAELRRHRTGASCAAQRAGFPLPGDGGRP